MTNDPLPDGGRLQRWGAASWRLLGIIAVLAVAALAIGFLAGIVIPLLVAVYMAILAVPLVDKLADRHVPRPVGAASVMAALIAILVGAFVLAGVGVADQSDEIRSEVASGFDELRDWFDQSGLDWSLGQSGDQTSGQSTGETTDQAGDQTSDQTGGAGDYQRVLDAGKQVLPGAAAGLASVFNSAVALVAGLFLSLFILYYLLVDWNQITHWFERHIGVSARVGSSIVDDASAVMRQNFGALTITSLIVSAIIGVAMMIMGLPLVFAVALVTFLTSYIPYVGAVFSGAFGFLIALGAGGTRDALILLIVILVAQNVVQTVVGNKIESSKLSVHPLAGFLATIVGLAVAGLVGAIFATPLLALALTIERKLRTAPEAA